MDVDEAHLKGRRKVPNRFDQANTPTEHALSTKNEYYLVYSKAIDHAVTSIRSKFNQKGYITFSKVEQLFFKSCLEKCFVDELYLVSNFSIMTSRGFASIACNSPKTLSFNR